MIEYKEIKQINETQLIELFESVAWESGDYPKQLVVAINNYSYVVSAWDGDKCVGLVSSLDDTIMTAYVHYVLVNPAYQKYGIGKKMMELLLEHYQAFWKVCLIGVNTAIAFYERCGFVIDDEAKPMIYVNNEYKK